MANISLSSLETWKPVLMHLQQAAQAVGVVLKVRYSDRTLHLLLEGAGVSSRKGWVAQVETLLKSYGVDSSSTVQILMYGRVKGKRYPAWKASIPLGTLPPQSLKAQKGRPVLAVQRLSRWMARPLRPAQAGFKDVQPPVSESTPVSPSSRFLDMSAELGVLGSQQWVARSILGVFLMAIGVYLYIGTWFLPQQARQWSALQPELDRIAATQPRNLEEMERLGQEITKTIAQLRRVSPLAGVFYQRARAQTQILNDRQAQLEYRVSLEQAGQTYLGQAKRLAAQATILRETQPSGPETQSPEDWRSIQQNWLVALYWLNQVPAQTFAIRERNQLLRQYQQTYWQVQQDIKNSFQFNGNL